jgi:cyclase
MLSKRIIICLDVRDGKTTKGVRFMDNIDIGDPVAMAKDYYEQGVDELVFYDITASSDRRDIMIDVVKGVAENIFIPFSVGGGIRTLDDMYRVLDAGAEKISVNSAAVLNHSIISEGARHFGNQCIVLGMDAKKVEACGKIPCGYEVVINGAGPHGNGRPAVGQTGPGPGRGRNLSELHRRGRHDIRVRTHADLAHLQERNIPVIASGGAGKPEHLRDVFLKADADAALIASMVHYKEYSIGGIKEFLKASGIPVRTTT